MKRTLLFLLMICLFHPVFGQSVRDITSSPDYLYGEGKGRTLKEADENALAFLISQISVNVQSSFTSTATENVKNGERDFNRAVEHIVNTYSQATLTSTKRLVISNEPKAHVLRYILKKDIYRIFEARKAKVIEWIRLAANAESKLKIDDALRYYYWSYCLLKSLPNSGEVTAAGEDEKDVLLETHIPDRIRSILDDIDIKKLSEDGTIWELNFFYRGQPVTSLDYIYFDGMDWSNIISARDGRGEVELRPMQPDNLSLKCEYEFQTEAHIDKELETVMAEMNPLSFKEAFFSISRNSSPSESPSSQHLTELPTSASIITQAIPSVNTEKMERYGILEENMASICSAIRNRSYENIRELFTDEGWDTFRKIIAYGNARLFSPGAERLYVFLPFGDKTICRSLPMTFTFQNNNRVFTENVTFTFNRDLKVENLAFSLGQQAEKDIMTNEFWDEQARIAIMNFLEDYKTAFALKDLGYIEGIFDENAVIITGKVVRQAAPIENGISLNKNVVKYTRYTKDEYLRKLELSFSGKEFINIRFSNNDVVKLGTGGEMYGIQIKQDYYSSNYGDTGYLFLMVDINDPEAPIIKVRTWQPEKDPNFGIIGPEHF